MNTDCHSRKTCPARPELAEGSKVEGAGITRNSYFAEKENTL